ncbi:MAG: hypothetical protein O6945_13645, partial [Gammaproteobacteria bacterium]|nr:hypothetical protein [Gammaproteobacteria bacterium]
APTAAVIAFNIPQLIEIAAPELLLAGADELLDGDGGDAIAYDTADIAINGLDSLLIGSSVDLTGVANLADLKQIEANGTVDGLSVDIADVLDIAGDTSLEAFLSDDIDGDATGSIILDGWDLSSINSGVTALASTYTPEVIASDVLEGGETYVQFVASLNSIDLYIHTNLVNLEVA